MEQTETAALKAAGDTRNELFSRDVTHMYTAATSVFESRMANSSANAVSSLTKAISTKSTQSMSWTRHLPRLLCA